MILAATTHTYKQLQPFETIDQLNANTIAIRKQFNNYLTSSAKKVLDFLHTHACKFFGVCYMSKNKIARELGVHRTTVIRACNQLELLGVIVQYETKRVKGDKRQSTNAIVFVHQLAAKEAFITNATPECDTIDTLLEAPNNINHTDDTGEFTKKNHKEWAFNNLKQKLPRVLQYAVAPFCRTADELYDMVGTIYKAKSSVDNEIKLEDYEQEYYHHILSVVNAWKRGKIDSLHGVMYRVIQKTTRRIWAKRRLADCYGIYE